MKYIALNKSKIIKNRYTYLFLQHPQQILFILITNIHFKTNNNKQLNKLLKKVAYLKTKFNEI